MKIKELISAHWQSQTTAVLGVGVFCLWLFHYPHLLLAREQTQLFVWNTDYLLERLAIPGGLAQWLGECIAQFFLNPVYGACWYAAFFVAAQLLTWRLLNGSRRPAVWLLSLVPSLVLCWLWMNLDIPLTFTVAVVLALALMNLLPDKKGRFFSRTKDPSLLLSLLLVVVGYWLLGPAIVLMVLKRGSRRDGSFVATKEPSLRTLLLLLTLVACVVGSSWLAPYPLQQLACGVDYYWEGDKAGTDEEMAYDRLLRQQRWEKIAEKYEQGHSESLASRNVAMLAQYNLHRIGRQELYGNLVLTKHALKSIPSCFLMSEVAMQVGLVNVAQRTAFEAMEAIPNYNKSARSLHRLVETNLITGHPEVALKYITILEQTTFYRGWARQMKPLALHPENIKAHPYFQKQQEIYDNGEDTFFY